MFRIDYHGKPGAVFSAALAAIALVALAGCGATPSAPATATPAAPQQATAQATAESTPTEPFSTPTTAPTPQPMPSETAAATPTSQPIDVSRLVWRQLGLAGTGVTDIEALEGPGTALAGGPQGAWLSTPPHSQWDQLDAQPAAEARNGSVKFAGSDLLFFMSNTGCPSGLPISASRSTDGGATWSVLSEELLGVAPAEGGTVYGYKCPGLVKSTDSGKAWTDLPSTQRSSDPISMAASPDGQTVFAAYVSEGGTGQIWESTNGGATWTDITPSAQVDPLEGFRAPGNLTYLPGSVGRPDDGGLYLTNDQGIWHRPPESTDWTLIKKEPVPGEETGGYDWYTAFMVDTAYSTEYEKPGPILYVARAKPSEQGGQVGLGVWRSADLGATWQLLGSGLDGKIVNALALAIEEGGGNSARVETLLAATDDGVWGVEVK